MQLLVQAKNPQVKTLDASIISESTVDKTIATFPFRHSLTSSINKFLNFIVHFDILSLVNKFLNFFVQYLPCSFADVRGSFCTMLNLSG